MDARFLWSAIDGLDGPVAINPEDLAGLTVRSHSEWDEDEDSNQEDDDFGWDDEEEEEDEADDWEVDEDEWDEDDDWDA